MKKICVDKDKCIMCGSCVSIAPENFDFDEDGTSKVINSELTDNAKNAVDCCPTAAINIIEE